MAEENKAPQSEEKQEAKKDSVRHNWVTDIYDKMDIYVRTLDIAGRALRNRRVLLYLRGETLKTRIILKNFSKTLDK